MISSLVLSLLGLLTYGPAVRLEYGRADDYWLVMHNATHTPGGAAHVWMGAGRFLPAMASRWLFAYVDSVPELLQLRVVAIVCLSLTGAGLCVMTLRLLRPRRSPFDRAVAGLVGLVVLVTPAAPSAATWGVMALQLWALPLALASGLVATSARPVLRMRWEVPAGVLLLLSTFTYQPAAAASLLPVFMWSALRWARREPPEWRRPVTVTVMLILSLVANVLVVKALDWGGTGRIGGHGLGQALLWLVGEYLPRTVVFGVPGSAASLGLTLIALLAGLLSPLTSGRRFLALPASVVAAWLVASSMLVPGDLWASYRLVMTPQITLWCGSAACLAFTLGERHRARPAATRSLVAASAVAAVALMGVSGFRAYGYLAEPNAVDWASARCVVRDSGGLTAHTVLVLSPPGASLSPVRAYDEYGRIASGTAWSLRDMAWLAARATDGNTLAPTVGPARLRVVKRSSQASTAPGALTFAQDVCGTLSPAP